MAVRTTAQADATERMRALLHRWQQSLELHVRYLTLDDAHYWHVQPWPKHERPAAWIVNLARDERDNPKERVEMTVTIVE